MMHKIRVIGFDGNNYWKLLYVTVKDNEEVYYGLPNKRFRLEYSRHGSGKFHTKINGKISKLPKELESLNQRKPLKELNRIENLGTFLPINK